MSAHSVIAAWTHQDGQALHHATESLLGAGVYTASCLDTITQHMDPLDGSALRMDALMQAAEMEHPLGVEGGIAHAALFALPLIGTPYQMAAFSGQPETRAALAAGIAHSGLVSAGSVITILHGVWNGADLTALHPQMLRDALLEACRLWQADVNLAAARLSALAGLPSTLHQQEGDVGGVAIALVVDAHNPYATGRSDGLRALLHEQRAPTAHTPDPATQWAQAWRAHGPAEHLSTLVPVGMGAAAAACTEIDCISLLLESGGSSHSPVDTFVSPTPSGGALIQMSQRGRVLCSHTIDAPTFAAIGASLLDRFTPPDGLDEDEDEAPSVPPMAALTRAPSMAAFLADLCPPRGQLH